jgi:hypothetical protein
MALQSTPWIALLLPSLVVPYATTGSRVKQIDTPLLFPYKAIIVSMWASSIAPSALWLQISAPICSGSETVVGALETVSCAFSIPSTTTLDIAELAAAGSFSAIAFRTAL